MCKPRSKKNGRAQLYRILCVYNKQLTSTRARASHPRDQPQDPRHPHQPVKSEGTSPHCLPLVSARRRGLAALNPPFFLPFLFPFPSLFSFPSPSFLVFQFSLIEATTMKKLPLLQIPTADCETAVRPKPSCLGHRARSA